MNRWAHLVWASGLVLAALSACSLRNGGGSGTPEVPEMDKATAVVSAETGGSVALGDGTVVEIPAGALAEDTEISISRPEALAFSPEGVLAAVLLEPEGTVFSKPVTVTIPFDPNGVEDTNDLVVVMVSGENPQVVGGSEVSAFTTVEDAKLTGSSFVVSTQHFSAFAIAYAPQVFVTPALPAKYLRPGDMLYTVTTAEKYSHGSMWPMHAGLFTGGSTGDEVIESTVETPDCNRTARAVQKGTWSGNCGFWHLNGEHILVGIRRPSIKATAQQGEAAAKAAESYLGTPYGIVGLSSAVTGLTCVQLVEQAWEIAGINVCYTPDILLTPFNQYQNTVPVKAITVDVKDGEVKIPIVIAAKEGYSTDYTALGKARIDGTVKLTADISDPIDGGRAVLKDAPMDAQEFKFLSFTPNQDDVDWSYTFGLEITVPELGYTKTVKDFLKVSVTGQSANSGTPCPLPGPLTAATPYYGGTLTGTTSTGGEFTIGDVDEFPMKAKTYLYRHASGAAWIQFYSGGTNGAFLLDFPLPDVPKGGVTQTITHPGANWEGSYGETGQDWGYNCSLSDGRLQSFSTFDTFSGTVQITPSSDCSKVTVEIQQSDTAWDELESKYVECVYQGQFTGVLCDPGADPQKCL